MLCAPLSRLKTLQILRKFMGHTQYFMKSKVGPLYLVASQVALEGVFFHKQKIPLVHVLDVTEPAEKILALAAKQLEEYFAGKRKRFSLKLHYGGTVFQKKVWQALSMIPFGQTAFYRDIAKEIKNPKAVRAVGSANGKNPFCIIIPCHRVISSDGKLGGYSGGPAIKRALLKHEGVPFK